MIESDKIEVVDFSGEKFSKFSIPCSVVLILVFLLTVSNLILTVLFSGSLISTLLSLGIIAIFVLYFYFIATKSLGKMRLFSISTKEIEFSIPNIPIFQILWVEFDKIEIKLKSFHFEPYSRYYFHFFQDQIERTFDISLWDFPKKKLIIF